MKPATLHPARSPWSVVVALARGVGVVALGAAAGAPLWALRTEDRQLKSNGQVEYAREAVPVERFSEVFTRGVFYARARTHAFWWDWEEEKTTGSNQTRDNRIFGVGGSVVFRSARWQGWSGVAGFYTSHPLHGENTAAAVPVVNFGRSGKDTYRTRPDGTEGALNVLAEAYAEYRRQTVTFRAGRQLMDTLLLSSNDSKMVPNAFEAARLEWRAGPKTKLGTAFVQRQKLRDHSTFHSVIAYAKSLANDDSGAHRGFTGPNLAAAGRGAEPGLLLFTAEDRTLPNCKIALEYAGLAGLFGTAVADASYEMKLGGNWTLTPGVRLLYQADHGGGAIGGAALSGIFARDRVFTASAADRAKLAAYRDPRSLESGLWAARVQLARGPLQLTAGTSAVADRADLVAPWRGFPSGGYTRMMGQVDWLAGAVNHLARVDYDLGRNRLCSSLQVSAAYVRMNFDNAKVETGCVSLTDRSMLTVDLTTSFRLLPRTAIRVRSGFVDAAAKPGVSPLFNYESYREFRLELNHFY